MKQQTTITRTFRKSWPLLLLFILSNLWVGLQAIPSFALSIDVNSTLQQFVLGWGLIGFLVLALLLINSSLRIRWTIYTLVISGLFQATYGSLMTLSGIESSFLLPKDTYLGVATGTFINRNHLAGYLVICLSMGLGMMIALLNLTPSGNWRNRLRRWITALLSQKILLRLALVMMVIGLVLTHSRMGNTSFFAAMMITGVLALLLSKHASRSTLILLSSLIIIDIFIVGTFFGIEKVVDRLENTSSQRETRDEVDHYSLTLMSNNLLLGSGSGTFYTAFPEYREADIRLFYDHAHNDYLEFLTERGLIGFIPLLLAIILSFLVALKAQWTRRNPLMRGLSFGCLMSMIAMGMHATVDFNLQIPANAASFMLVLALGWISFYHQPVPKKLVPTTHYDKDSQAAHF
nr:O-antigen ligase family protein [Neptunomonas qingdaonensis]